MLSLQEASEHKALGKWFVDSLTVCILRQTFALDSVRIQLMTLPVFSTGHNNKDTCWGFCLWFFLVVVLVWFLGFFVFALVRLPVHLLLKFKRLKQSWFCLACKLAICPTAL